MERIYNTAEWREVASRAKARDGHRCTVGRLLGGECSGGLHVHHLIPVSEGGDPFDLANTGTACASHHPAWESLRRSLLRARQVVARRCPHRHRWRHAREECERRLNRLAA